jgi:CheY-like chemotaxis protein
MIDMTKTRMIDLLLVDDSDSDVRLTQELLKESKVRNTIHRVEDGVEAMAFLRKEGKYRGVPTPDLVLLDLNMPRKDGRAVLQEIKEDPALRRIPVVVLTTSREETDILKAYNLYANCYVQKPFDLEQFIYVVRTIEDFWLSIVALPGK